VPESCLRGKHSTFFLRWTYNGIILVPLQALAKGNFIYLYTEILKFHQFRWCMLFEKIIY
jgi:hypothetical protein